MTSFRSYQLESILSSYSPPPPDGHRDSALPEALPHWQALLSLPSKQEDGRGSLLWAWLEWDLKAANPFLILFPGYLIWDPSPTNVSQSQTLGETWFNIKYLISGISILQITRQKHQDRHQLFLRKTVVWGGELRGWVLRVIINYLTIGPLGGEVIIMIIMMNLHPTLLYYLYPRQHYQQWRKYMKYRFS